MSLNNRKSLNCVLSLLLPAVFSTGFAYDLPDFGDSAGAAVSPVQERRVGEAFYRKIRGDNAIVEDPEVMDYVNQLGNKLVAHSGGSAHPYTFFVVKALSINAFAGPGGYIGMHAGLILNTRTESELAGVLAHEIAHVTQRHLARTFERAGQLSLPMAAAMLGAVLLAAADPQAAQAALAAVSAGSQQYQINFTRANEKEADRVGIQLLARSGFDPRGMPGFFERLQLANRLTDPKHLPEFLRTHPVTVSRIADSRNRLAQLPVTEHKDSLAFHLTQAKLHVAAAKNPVEAVRYFEQRLRNGEFANENAARYGYALALIEAGEYGKAQLQIGRLIRHNSQNHSAGLAYRLAAGQLALKERRTNEVLGIYADLYERYPHSRPVLLHYTQALLTANVPEQARKLLREYARHYGSDLDYYRFLVEVEGRAGAVIESHIAKAEVFYLSGELEQAHRQLEIAQGQKPFSYYQKERIKARLAEFDKELEEAKKARRRF